MTVYPKLTNGFNAVLTRILEFFVDIDNLILKCKWNCKESRIPKTDFKKNEGLFILFHLKTIVTAIKTV